jgi:hypothetical protein
MPDLTTPEFEIHTEPVPDGDELAIDPGTSIAGHVSIWFDEDSGKWERVWRRRAGSTRSCHNTYNDAVDITRACIADTVALWERRAVEHEAGVDSEGCCVVALGGISYTVVPDLAAGTPPECAGYGGQRFVLRLTATGEQVETRNLWFYGAIPSEFAGRIPDNAEWVDADA